MGKWAPYSSQHAGRRGLLLSYTYEKGVGGDRNRGEMAKGCLAFGIGIPEKVGAPRECVKRNENGIPENGRHIEERGKHSCEQLTTHAPFGGNMWVW